MNSLNPCEIPRVSYALKIQSTLRSGGISKGNFFNDILLIKKFPMHFSVPGNLVIFRNNLLEHAILLILPVPNKILLNQELGPEIKEIRMTISEKQHLRNAFLEYEIYRVLEKYTFEKKKTFKKYNFGRTKYFHKITSEFRSRDPKDIFRHSSPILNVIRAMITQTDLVCIPDFPHCLLGNMPMIGPIGNPLSKRPPGDQLKMD